MGIREKMNDNPGITTGVTAAIVLLAIVFIVYEIWPSNSAGSAGSAHAYFSDDDGKTWFTDSSTNVPPYTHDGKEAVLASVFKCSDGTTFVGYLQKYSPDAKKLLDHPPPGMIAPITTSLLVKKPGAAKWFSFKDREYNDIRNVKCPSGGADAEEVAP